MPTPTPISVRHVEIYMEFNGDADMYQRRGMPKSGELGDIWGAWGTIDDLRQRLGMVASGRTSPRFAASVEADLLSYASDEETRRMVRVIVERDGQSQK